MPQKTTMRLTSPSGAARVTAPPRPLHERGRMLYAEDIRELYGKKPDGRWRKSLDWIWENFAPEHRHKDGKAPWWFETDVACWFDEQLEGRRA